MLANHHYPNHWRNALEEVSLPARRAGDRHPEKRDIKQRNDAFETSHLSWATRHLSAQICDPREAHPPVPRIRYDAKRTSPFWLDSPPCLYQEAVTVATQILPADRKTFRSDSSTCAAPESCAKSIASKTNGIQVIKQCLPPPTRKSIRRQSKSQPQPQLQPPWRRKRQSKSG